MKGLKFFPPRFLYSTLGKENTFVNLALGLCTDAQVFLNFIVKLIWVVTPSMY